MNEKDSYRNVMSFVEAALAAIVVAVVALSVTPRYTAASSESKIRTLVDGIEAVRCSIKLYRIQHNDSLPGSGPAGFVEALTERTNLDGAVDAAGRYGPYLRKIPVNPFNDLNGVEVEAGSIKVGSGDFGWHFDSVTGEFCADTEPHTSL